MSKESQIDIVNQSQSQPVIRMNFITDYIKKIELNVQKTQYALSKLRDIIPKTEFQILPKYTGLGNNEYEVSLEVKLKMLVSPSEEVVFDLALECGTIYKLDGTVDLAIIEAALLVDGVTLLFPFCRQEVARITMSSGFMPIKLDPLDFRRLYTEYKTKSSTENLPQAS